MANPSHDLLPCPFCGGAARIESNRDWHRIYAAHDDECVFDADDHALMYPAQPGYLIQIAEDWNRRATPPSPSTAPEDLRDLFDLAWKQALSDAAFYVAGHCADGERHVEHVLELVPPKLRVRGVEIASRPAEVDDEGLPPLPATRKIGQNHLGFIYGYDAEQYRQGQRDAVAADRTRRGGQP